MDAPPPAPDLFSAARDNMVDSQVRPNKVTDPRVLRAMRRLPRERFVPPASLAWAYADEDVPLGGSRVLMEPMVIARLIQLTACSPGERALVVGAGPGYGAAVLAACGAEVTALEEDARLSATARALLSEFAPAVRVVNGPLRDGWAEGAPWDVILIEGAVAAIPPAIAGQLRTGTGRLVTVIAATGRVGQAVLAERGTAGLSVREIFDCATPLLPSMAPVPGFVF